MQDKLRMSASSAICSILVVGLAVVGSACSSTGAALSNVRPLDKVTAAKLLTSMGYGNVTVAAVVQGASVGISGPTGGSDSGALAVGTGVRGGKAIGFHEVFMFDKDIGWFYFEVPKDNMGSAKGPVRLWTEQGYREVLPTGAETPGK